MNTHPALDAAGIGRLYATHARKLRNFLLHKTRDDQIVDDLVQEAFIRAFVCRDSYKGESEPETWLCAIAMNAFRNRYKAGRRDRLTDSIDEFYWEPSTEDVLEAIERNDTLKRVDAAWREMSVEMQRAMEAVVIDEVDYAGAADMLSVPIGTIRSRVHRGRALLRDAAG